MLCCFSREADYTTGIFQSIGFKEFHDYLLLPEDERGSTRGQHLLQKGEQLTLTPSYLQQLQIAVLFDDIFLIQRPEFNISTSLLAPASEF